MGSINPCHGCRNDGRCRDQAEVSRLALFGWAKGLKKVNCIDYRERFYRGLEGVRA